MSAHTLRWQGWGISLGLHTFLASALVILWPGLRLAPAPDPFRWQVKMVQATAPAQMQPAPAPTPVQESPAPVESTRPVETVVAKRPVQRAAEQSRPVQQRNHPIVRSRLMTRDKPIEQARALPATRQAVQPVTESRQVAATIQSMARPQGEATQGAVQAVVAQTEVSNEAESREAVQSRESVHRQAREEGVVETIERTGMPRPAPVEHSVTQTERVEAEQTTSIRHSEPVVSAVHSAGRARAHYGWLKADLMAYIERVKRYPQFALDNKWEGRVVVRAVIWADGTLTDLRVVESSGHEVLDRESLELLKRISPLSLKHQLGAPQVTLRIPINYGIH